jgi:hypothetical protein
MKPESLYVTMRDGVRIAVDVYVPKQARAHGPVPAIIRQTRYLRNVDYNKPFDSMFHKWLADTAYDTRMYMLDKGYAWLDVDARGSGASTGRRPCPWSEHETRDGAEVVDWIVAQPWCSGAVGTMGISYNGTTAEMLLANRHPAVKAAILQFCLFDVFTDVAFPGGIHQFYFTEFWNIMNSAFDRNEAHSFLAHYVRLMAQGLANRHAVPGPARRALSEAAGHAVQALMKPMVRGVRPTRGDADYALVREAVAGHSGNFNVHQGAQQITFRDDTLVSPGAEDMGALSIDYFSPHTYVKDIDASGAAVFSYAGWWDMGYQHAAIKRHMTLTNPDNRLIIGGWDHGGRHDIGPATRFRPCTYDHNREFVRFFDHHLKGKQSGMQDVPRVRYYTMGENKWKSADQWPPPGARARRLFLAPGRSLARTAPAAEHAADRYRVDTRAGTGDYSRWKSGLGMNIDYTDRARRDRLLLVYDSAPLDRAMEVTGHPAVTLYVASTAPDGNFYAYLEEVTPHGEVRYVTEGCLRALHRKISTAKPPHQLVAPYHTYTKQDAAPPLDPVRPEKLVFDLLPTSYRFARGNRIRLALAGADCDHALPQPGPAPVLRIQRSRTFPSHVDLPVMGS